MKEVKIPLSIMLPLIFEICAIVALTIITIIQLTTISVKILDYYILLILFVACFGLLHTSCAIIKDWKKFCKEKGV